MPTPKKPADKQPKTVQKPKIAPEEVPGWDLMRPLEEIPAWEQTDLVAILQEAMDDGEPEIDTSLLEGLTPNQRIKKEAELKQAARSKSFDVRIIGTLAKQLKEYAKDPEEYTKFVSGSGAMERAMNLAMAWVGQMGEFSSSENS
jgi:hypothetical protein